MTNTTLLWIGFALVVAGLCFLSFGIYRGSLFYKRNPKWPDWQISYEGTVLENAPHDGSYIRAYGPYYPNGIDLRWNGYYWANDETEGKGLLITQFDRWEKP